MAGDYLTRNSHYGLLSYCQRYPVYFRFSYSLDVLVRLLESLDLLPKALWLPACDQLLYFSFFEPFPLLLAVAYCLSRLA